MSSRESALRIVYDNMPVEDVCRRLKSTLNGAAEDVYNGKKALAIMSRMNNIGDKLKKCKDTLVEELLDDIRDRLGKQMELEALDSLFSDTEVTLLGANNGRVYALPPWPMMMELLMTENTDNNAMMRMVEEAITQTPHERVFQRVYVLTKLPPMKSPIWTSETPTVCFTPFYDVLGKVIHRVKFSASYNVFTTDAVMDASFDPTSVVDAPEDIVVDTRCTTNDVKTGKLWMRAVMSSTVLAFPDRLEYGLIDAVVGKDGAVTPATGNVAIIPATADHNAMTGVYLQMAGDVLVRVHAALRLFCMDTSLHGLMSLCATQKYVTLVPVTTSGVRVMLEMRV